MDSTNCVRQQIDKPLFPELEWSRPENKLHAGKLLIVGGNAHGFAAPAEAYSIADKAGVGAARVVLPQRVRALVGNVLDTVEYAMGNPSGGFSQMALGDILSMANWADATLLAGDFGRNSETAILLEKFIAKHSGQIIITKDAVDYFVTTPLPIADRNDTLVVLSMAQLQKLAISMHFAQPFTFGMDLVRLVDALHVFTAQHPLHIITRHLDTICVAVDGRVSTTKVDPNQKVWRLHTATKSSVWWLQNPAKPFEALTTAVL